MESFEPKTIEEYIKGKDDKLNCICNFEGEYKSIFIYRKDNSGIIRVSFEEDSSFGFISDLFVKREVRNQRIGTELLHIAENVIGYMTFPFTQLRVKKGTWMEGWYKRNGYIKMTVEEKDYIFMTK